MKNPNGYGSVAKMSGNRRRPFVVRKTEGFDARGYPIYKVIGYTATREEGLMLLADYNRQPWNTRRDTMTLDELYSVFVERRLPRYVADTQKTLRSAYKHIAKYGKVPYSQLRAYQMQECIDGSGGYGVQMHIKHLWRNLDKLALEMDIVTKCYSSLLYSAAAPQTTRIPFTPEEVCKLWNNLDIESVDTVLILLYTGFRFSEFLGIRLSNVSLDQWTITGGVKTKAGKNRVVPIHTAIRELVAKRAKEAEAAKSEKLFNCSEKAYRSAWTAIMKKLKMKHVPHECRHTLRTALDAAGANPVCIDRILGHQSPGTGERVYTHKTLNELREAIELVSYGMPRKL